MVCDIVVKKTTNNHTWKLWTEIEVVLKLNCSKHLYYSMWLVNGTKISVKFIIIQFVSEWWLLTLWSGYVTIYGKYNPLVYGHYICTSCFLL